MTNAKEFMRHKKQQQDMAKNPETIDITNEQLSQEDADTIYGGFDEIDSVLSKADNNGGVTEILEGWRDDLVLMTLQIQALQKQRDSLQDKCKRLEREASLNIEQIEREQKLHATELKSLREQLEAVKAERDKLKKKADRWDKLDSEIGKFYPENDEDAPGDLGDIGELAATAFGYMYNG